MTVLEIIDTPSPNFDEREADVDMLVLHYTGMASGEAARALLTDPAPVAGRYASSAPLPIMAADAELPRVSAHYVVEEDGRVFRLVAEDQRAWHAGVSSWAGEGDVNARSVGVEIVNGGHDYGLPQFPPEQIASVIALARAVTDRWRIPPGRVLGHSDVAPGRKRDPGPRFPWAELAQAGVGLDISAVTGGAEVLLRPGDEGPEVARLQADLAEFGYDAERSGFFDPATEAVVTAFRDRWRGASEPAAETPHWRALDEARLQALLVVRD